MTNKEFSNPYNRVRIGKREYVDGGVRNYTLELFRMSGTEDSSNRTVSSAIYDPISFTEKNPEWYKPGSTAERGVRSEDMLWRVMDMMVRKLGISHINALIMVIESGEEGVEFSNQDLDKSFEDDLGEVRKTFFHRGNFTTRLIMEDGLMPVTENWDRTDPFLDGAILGPKYMKVREV